MNSKKQKGGNRKIALGKVKYNVKFAGQINKKRALILLVKLS